MVGLVRLNDRMIRSGATGRGATPGKASPGLVYTVVKPKPPTQFELAELHAWTWKLRSALNRPSPGPIIALTCTRLILCGPPASLTVTDWPPTGAVSRSSHWVPSVSSIRLAWLELVPMLDATVAPLLEDAQLVGIATVTVDVC